MCLHRDCKMGKGSFGQRLVMPKGTSFWATNEKYFTSVNDGRGARRDVLVLHGTESAPESGGGQQNALCCLAVCFVTISNLFQIRSHFSLQPITDEIGTDRMGSITYILGR